jgi:23S rRNA pseudouridine955/2504/2580 synthase/23S rRNA pseudouridine1911/1915/1917 synthase
MQRRVRFQIPKDRAGISLLDFLAFRFRYHTRDDWQNRITSGHVRLNDEVAAPDRVLAYRDRIDYVATAAAEPAVRFDVAVVFDDDALLVVNKPPNLVCHPCGRYFEHTLWAWARREAGLDEPIFVNRIDRETSGLVVIARTAAAAKRCRAEFIARRVEKHYVAIVEGAFPERVAATGWMVDEEDGPVRKRRRFIPAEPESPAPAGGQWAVTRLRRAALHGPLSKVHVDLDTGRRHQIRATLLALGFPLVGDKLYGVDPAFFLGFCTDALTDHDRLRLRLDRQALHAEGLRFRHPVTQAMLDLHAPMAEDMQALITGHPEARALSGYDYVPSRELPVAPGITPDPL